MCGVEGRWEFVGAAELAGEDVAVGVEDFGFDFFVVWRQGGLGVSVEGGGGGVCGWNVGGGAEDEGAEGEVVEDFAAIAPDVGGAVFADALVVEAVDRGDLAGLVVAADKGNAIRVSNFEAK